MTRIIAGIAGGRRLRTPVGTATRPTSDRVREALFSALEARLGTLAGCRFLDAYAGSGAVGLEASSRGAACVTMVEHDSPTAALIRANAQELGMSAVHIVTSKVERAHKERPPGGDSFDVAFFDPPYDLSNAELAAVVSDLDQAGWLAHDVLLVVERPRRAGPWRWQQGFETLRERRYGETVLCYGQRAEVPRSSLSSEESERAAQQ